MAKYSNGLEDCLDIPEASVTVLEKRYLEKDKTGKILETGEDMFRRVAKDLAAADAFYHPDLKDKTYVGMPTKELYSAIGDHQDIKSREEEYFDMMSNLDFLPNSPTLMNAGRKLQQLSACFVLPIEDSIEEIYETQKNMATVHKTGGGTGFSFSSLRPNGAFIHSTDGFSPGPLSFLFSYNETAGQTTQGGKRRGANMGILRANHPDAYDWANVKSEEGVLSNFNLSITFTDEEMKAVRNDGYILLDDPREGKGYGISNMKNRATEIIFGKQDKYQTALKLSEDETKILDSYTGKEVGKIEDEKIYMRARSLFDKIIDGAWKKGEPGIIFIDSMNRDNPHPDKPMEATNPCGEQPLPPYESCNLGSVNLSNFITHDGKPDESRLEKTVRSAVRLLDSVIDRNKYSLPQIEEQTKANRRIGLGVMGYAHALIKMGISYDSQEAIDTAEYFMKFINETAIDETKKLAKERGAFPTFNESIFKDEEPRRNATVTTIAPTGTIGVIASTSQGIEPIYEIVQERAVKDSLGVNLIETDREFKDYLKRKGIYDEKILNAMSDPEKAIGLDDLLIPKPMKDEMKRLFVTAKDLSPEQHIKIQAAFQKHTSNAVSKTINMPNSATREDIYKAYLLAHELGCKGLTVYRDGSRTFELLSSMGGGLEGKVGDVENQIHIPPIMPAVKIKQSTPWGNIHATIVVDPSREYAPVEIFTNLGDAGSVEMAEMEGFGRMTSLWLRSGGNVNKLIKQLESIGSGTSNISRDGKVQSIPMGFARALKKFQLLKENYGIENILTGKTDYDKANEEISDIIRKGMDISNGETSLTQTQKDADKFLKGRCPECGARMIVSEGCEKCSNSSCGFSMC